MPSGTVVSGLGTLLKRGNGDGPPETFTTIPKIRTLGGPNPSTDVLDTTTLDTTGGFDTWITGLKHGGSVTFELDFMPDDTMHQKMLGDWVNGIFNNYELHWPDGVTLWKFTAAYVKPTDPQATPTTVLTSKLELKISGQPTLITA